MIKSVKQDRTFFRDTKGNIAPFFGLLAIPMMAITGGAVDIGQAITQQSDLQKALDSAAVAVCSAGSGTQTPDEVMRAFLAAQFASSQLNLNPPVPAGQQPPSLNVHDVELENTGLAPDGSFSPRLRSLAPTSLLKLVGINQIDLEAETSVKCGAKRLELSLVLDVTGSMNNSVGGKKKIDSMKEASHDVVDIFERNLDAGATRIALVPFSEAVNVGSYANAVRGTISDGTSTSVGKSKLKFRNKYYNWRYYNSTSCVSERLGAQKYTDAAPSCSGNSCSAPVGHVYTSNGSCKPSHQLQPLTSDKASLRQQIDTYSPNGGTAGHIGAAWGWYTVSDKWSSVFTGTAAPEVPNPDELIKATIIMTDGEFNEEYYNGVDDDNTYYSSNNGSSNSQFEQICEAMKDPNGDGVYDEDSSVIVYTVGFGLNENSATAQRLKNCATDNTKYFFPYNGEELRAAFKSIGKSLSGGQAGQALVQR